MKVHGVILSPFVRKVLAVCKLKGLEYEHERTMPGVKEPEFLAISPLAKIPAFSDGDFGFSDSSVICEYLEEQYPQRPVLPPSPQQRALSRWYEEYADTWLATQITVFFFERRVKPMMNLGETDEARLAQVAEEEHPKIFGYLEGVLPDKGFLFGKDLMLADVALFCPFANGEYGGLKPDAAQWPRLASFLGRVREHPVMAELLAAEQKVLKSMGF